MNEHDWLEITINVPAAKLDDVCTSLTLMGMTGLVIEEEDEFKQFLENNQSIWDYVDDALLSAFRGVSRVKFYLPDTQDGKKDLARYTEPLGYEYTALPLKESDWAYSWQKYYTPFPVGNHLYIVPQWLRNEPLPEGKVPVYLNPGLTFGTGSHTSTQLCLCALEHHVTQGCTIADLGCGSGILSIAALALGAQRALAVDIDPMCVPVVNENAQFNEIDPSRLTVLSRNILSDSALQQTIQTEKYPIVVANIVADVIIALAPMVPSFLTENGVFICSGIIDTRADEVCAALLKNGFTLLNRRDKDGWCALEVTRA